MAGGGNGRLQRRLSESNNAPLPPSIPCEACDATFDSRQMKNDHFLLMHPAPPPPKNTPLSPLADDDVTADDKVTWFIWDTMEILISFHLNKHRYSSVPEILYLLL